jgi:DNA-binding MarR family transcriptional regulator
MSDFVLDPSAHDTPAAKIVFALERLSHVFRIQWWAENQNFQISPLQMQILVMLRFQTDLDSVTAVAGYLQLTNPTISDAVRVLVEKGYVDKQPHMEDGRRHRLTLTAAGVDAAERLALFANQLRDFVGALPHQGVFLEALLQLMEQLQVIGFIPFQRMCTTCRHLQRPESVSAPYYCQLLAQPLLPHDLRIHCPEHEAVV